MSGRSTASQLRPLRTRAYLKGFTLVEMMIAMTLSLLVLAAIGWVYLGTMRTYRSHDALARMQEGARYAFEIIGKDLRMIGATGCSYTTSANSLNNPTSWYENLFDEPLSGANQDGTAGAYTEISDSLSAVHADFSREYIVQLHNSATQTFTLTANHDLASGQLMLATDCANAAVFQASSATTNVVRHVAGGENFTANLGAGGTVYGYTPGSRLYRLHSATYYVKNNSAGVPALFRDMPVGVAATPTGEELVEGVEDMRITYGVDTTATPDGQADYVAANPYLTAAEIDAPGTVPGATAALRWARVVSVRISLVMRSVDDRVVSTQQKYNFNGALVTATDLRMHKVFTHVIKVRNR